MNAQSPSAGSLVTAATIVAGMVLFAAVAHGQNGELGPDGKPKILEEIRIEQRLHEQVPGDLVFRDEEDREVRLSDYYGKRPVVLALVYFRCPMLCTEVVNQLVASLRQVPLDMGKDFDVLVVSFDPADTPAVAKKKRLNYLELYGREGADAGWHFLTGQQESIDAITQAAGFHYVYDKKTNQFAHPAGIMILTPDGTLSKYFYGLLYNPRDLRLGLVDASQGKIGSTADQVLLYCFHYDPTMGKYTANIMNLLRASGAVTLLVIGVFLGLAWRRERRRAQAKQVVTE